MQAVTLPPGVTVGVTSERKRLWSIAKLLYGVNTTMSKEWGIMRCLELDDGNVEAVVKAMQRLKPKIKDVQDKVLK